MKWRNLHNSVGSDDLKKPESGPRRGRPRCKSQDSAGEIGIILRAVPC
jgi:hypothetical protein